MNIKLLFLNLIILLILLTSVVSSKRYKYGESLPLNQDTEYFYKNIENYQSNLIEARKKLVEVSSGISNIEENEDLTDYPVSDNCTNAFLPAMMSNPLMAMYTGVGFNELGNYESCIMLPANQSQYCLFDGTVDGLLPVVLGVCYPSAIYCSPDDVIGLMAQYSIIRFLQSNMTLNSTTQLKCYNQTHQTYTEAKLSTGVWVMTAISSFILLMVIIGTLVEYVFFIKLVSLRKRYSGNNNPYSLLNPKSYFESNYNNIINNDNTKQYGGYNNQDDGDDEDDGKSIGKRIEDPEPPFYFSFLDGFEISNEGIFVKFLLCWSLIKNFNSLVYSSSTKKHFNSLDGIRTLSTCWVILGHSILFAALGLGYDNIMYIIDYAFKPFSFQAIPAGEFAVDTFFMLSGFLVVYSVLGQLNTIYEKGSPQSKRGTIKFWIVYIVHRFVRLSPLYYFLLFFSMYVLPLMGTGPAYYMYYGFSYESCSSSWWTNLLYFNNLYSFLADECYAWAWYLANDMQFFLVTPIFILLFKKCKIAAWILVVALIAGCIINTTIIAYHYQLTPFFDMLGSQTSTSSSMITDIYQKPWNRCGPYLVGILIAFVYCDSNTSKRVKYIYHLRFTRYLIYVVALFITFFLSYIPYSFYKNQWSNYQNALFSGFAHTFFTIGLALFMLATMYGYGGVLKWFLELGIWKFFSKLTYSAYLVHPLVIMYRIYSMSNLVHYNVTEFSYMYISNLAFTFAFAFAIHLLIEKPFINIERLIFSK